MSERPYNQPTVRPDAVAALQKLWEEAAEISAVRWAYREAAAVLDSFKPEMLKPFNMEPTQGAYREYAEDAETISRAPKERWRLRTELRRESLQRLSTRTQMQAALATNQVRPGTPMQRMLEAVINGAISDLAGLTREELQALLLVHRWLEGILEPDELPDYDAVASAFSRADLLSPFEYLVSHGFVDRRRELGRLREFLWADRPTAPVLVLYGIGGVGKSTLLAKFILEQVAHCGDRLFLAPLDVDRPGIDPERPHTFLIDAVRQIARQRQALAAKADSVVQSLRELGGYLGGKRNGIQLESRYSEKEVYWLQEKFVAIFGEFISAALPAVPDCRVLISVDTFEEVQVRGNEVVSTLIRLFLDITRLHPAVRIVLSGRIRANESDLLPDNLLPNSPTICLRGLDKRSALSLLRRLIGANKPRLRNVDLEEIISVVGRNPMCLRLAARVVRLEGTEALLGDETRRKLLRRMEEEKIQAFLFGRILDHFHTDHIEPLAYPGLIVRRITPEVIREVLVEPCRLDVPDDAAAQKLYRELAQERTMVEPDGEGGLRYRPDLRRELLPDVLRKVANNIANEIDLRAVKLYSARQGWAARAEELYHRLRLGEPADILDSIWDPALREYLKGSVAELPIAGGLWLAGKLNITLDANTRAQADQETWEEAAALRAERYLRSGDTKRALSALHERSERLPGSRLYRLEADALRLSGNDQAALETVLQGLEGAPVSTRVDLLLFAALIDESRNELAAALSIAAEAAILAKEGDDRMLYLRALITHIRLLRKLGRKDERDVLREEALHLIDAQTLRDLGNYPRLLEEVAAELGQKSEAILHAAVKRLGVHAKSEEQENSLAKAFHSLANAEIVERVKQSVNIDPKIFDQMRSSFDAAKELVKQSEGAGLGKLATDLLKSTSILKVASDSFTDFFRKGVDQVINIKKK